MAQRSKVAIAHVAWQCKVLLEWLTVLVFTSPGLNSVQLGSLVVEDVGVDYGDEGKEGRRGC
jgi:hypothetical protein